MGEVAALGNRSPDGQQWRVERREHASSTLHPIILPASSTQLHTTARICSDETPTLKSLAPNKSNAPNSITTSPLIYQQAHSKPNINIIYNQAFHPPTPSNHIPHPTTTHPASPPDQRPPPPHQLPRLLLPQNPLSRPSHPLPTKWFLPLNPLD